MNIQISKAELDSIQRRFLASHEQDAILALGSAPRKEIRPGTFELTMSTNAVSAVQEALGSWLAQCGIGADGEVDGFGSQIEALIDEFDPFAES